MYAQALLVASLATLTTANSLFREAKFKRDLVEVEVRQIVNRRQATGAADPSATDLTCMTALLSIESSLPTPPPALLSYEMTASAATDPCAYTPPSNLGPDYSSYTAQIVSWYSVHSAELSSALAQCPSLSGLATATGNICESTGAASPAGKTTSAGGSGQTTMATTKAGGPTGGSSNGNGGSSSAVASSPSGGLAPRETGMVAAVVAAAGFIGAVVAL